MAIRSNIGNQVTNGMQILSVGLTTASRTLGSADKALNNMTKEERQMVKDAEKQRRIDAAKQYLSGGSNPYQHMTPEEQSTYQQERAKGMKAFRYKGDEEGEDINVETLVDGGEDKTSEVKEEENKPSEGDIVSGSSQAEELNVSTNNKLSWVDNYERDAERLRATEGME